MRLGNSRLFLLFILCGLTSLLELYSPRTPLESLIATSIAWPIIFVATCILQSFQSWGRAPEPSLDKSQGIEPNVVKVAVCFVLAHLCSAAMIGSREYVFANVSTQLDDSLTPRFCYLAPSP
jgi:hypothetical protein